MSSCCDTLSKCETRHEAAGLACLLDKDVDVVYCNTGGENMRTVLSVSLPDQIAIELDAFAKDTGRNKSDIVKESLGIFLWEAKFKKVKSRLVKKAKAANVITEEDVFRVVS
jgi:predicted transcriptional regulator